MGTKTIEKTEIKAQLRDIYLDITWSKIAKRYFSKSASWIYNKLSGTDGNGGTGDFSYEEKMQLKGGLYDLAERIRKAADSIE